MHKVSVSSQVQMQLACSHDNEPSNLTSVELDLNNVAGNVNMA